MAVAGMGAKLPRRRLPAAAGGLWRPRGRKEPGSMQLNRPGKLFFVDDWTDCVQDFLCSSAANLMARTKKLKTFKIGDKVYCRFFGSETLLIEDTFTSRSGFPHYVCSINGDEYVIPKIHLSTKTLIGSVDSGNRRQLRLDRRPST